MRGISMDVVKWPFFLEGQWWNTNGDFAVASDKPAYSNIYGWCNSDLIMAIRKMGGLDSCGSNPWGPLAAEIGPKKCSSQMVLSYTVVQVLACFEPSSKYVPTPPSLGSADLVWFLPREESQGMTKFWAGLETVIVSQRVQHGQKTVNIGDVNVFHVLFLHPEVDWMFVNISRYFHIMHIHFQDFQPRGTPKFGWVSTGLLAMFDYPNRSGLNKEVPHSNQKMPPCQKYP